MVSGTPMQQPPPAPPPWQPAAAYVPQPSSADDSTGRGRPRGRHRLLLVLTACISVALGTLLGGRAAIEAARADAAHATATGDPARAMALDEAVGARTGVLTLLDSAAPPAARHDAQVARIAWARRLGAIGQVDSAIHVLMQVGEPSLGPQAAEVRVQILVQAAIAAANAGKADLALTRLDQAAASDPSPALSQQITMLRAADEVRAAAVLIPAGHGSQAVALLDDAAAHGAQSDARRELPAALLAAAQAQIAGLDQQEAVSNLRRLVDDFPNAAQTVTAEHLLHAPSRVSGTLVDSGGHGIAARLRLSSHFSVVGNGYTTSGPFYTGTSDANGDFAVDDVPVGGPYVFEYFRDGWMTLVDPKTDQPANPVTVTAVVPVDLTFIVAPG